MKHNGLVSHWHLECDWICNKMTTKQIYNKKIFIIQFVSRDT